MHGLTSCSFGSCICTVKAKMRVRTEDTFRDGSGPGIGEDIVEEELGFDYRFLLDVSCFAAEVSMCPWFCVEGFGVVGHSGVQFVEVCWVDGVCDYAGAIFVEGLEGGLEVMG